MFDLLFDGQLLKQQIINFENIKKSVANLNRNFTNCNKIYGNRTHSNAILNASMGLCDFAIRKIFIFTIHTFANKK